MNSEESALSEIPFPRIAKICQPFNHTVLRMYLQLREKGGKDFAGYRSIKPSQRIAITGSSRKTDRMVEVLRALVNMVKERARIPL